MDLKLSVRVRNIIEVLKEAMESAGAEKRSAQGRQAPARVGTGGSTPTPVQ